MRQDTSATVSNCQDTSGYVRIRQDKSACGAGSAAARMLVKQVSSSKALSKAISKAGSAAAGTPAAAMSNAS